MKTLREYFQQAKAEQWTIGHFNFSTADQLKAIVEAAVETNSPVMVGTSEGEDNFLGHEQAVALVHSWRKIGYPVFLNADHHKSFASIKGAIDAGYDTVLIDGSRLSLSENIALTRQVVDYTRGRHRSIMIEGELGYLRGESVVQTKVAISPEDFTKPEEAKEFVEKTEADRLAIAFGNIHGITMEQEMHLDLELLKQIAAAVPETFLVLHGGSGLLNEEVEEAIKLGITNVHINTELRVAYHQALKEELAQEPLQSTPYKYLKPSFEAAKDLVHHKLELFGSMGKA